MTHTRSCSVVAPTGYLLLCTDPTVLALPAASVLAVVRATEWKVELPLPLSALVPIRFAAREPKWVISIGVCDHPMATLVEGSLRIEYLGADSLLPMPPLIGCGFGIYSEVILADGQPSALVVNTDALVLVHRELGK
jgi:hypothetical protein